MTRLELAKAWADDYRGRYNERTISMARMYVEQAMTYEQIAEEFNISRQRVGQLLKPMDLAKHQVDQRRALRARELEAAHARILTRDTSAAVEAKALGYANIETLRQALYGVGLKLPLHVRFAEPPHGTKSRYDSRRFQCRCDLCRKANADYVRSLRQSRPKPPSHGLSGYRNYGCKCPICRAAGRADNRNTTARRRQRKEVKE